MSVTKRKTSRGETGEYHYAFAIGGKRYRGVCEGCTTERKAQAYEKQIRDTVLKAQEQKTVKALVDNFADQLTGGKAIGLKEAFSLYLKKPKKRQPGEKQLKQKSAYWQDFFDWRQGTHPGMENLRDVQSTHAEAYIAMLRTEGSFLHVQEERQKTAADKDYKPQPQGLSPATVNVRHKTIKAVFAWLSSDAGIMENPFEIEFLDYQYESREAFTPEELKLIWKNLDSDPFVKPIFIIGVCTGLSEGDICNLRWSEIQDGWISRKRRKTGAVLEIPILAPLMEFLNTLPQTEDFILPEHAKMYADNPTGVTYRVKYFLEGLGISTTKKAEGRSRVVSIKDVHSLRHTFAYLAGINRTPLPVVQSVLGHMSPEMTKHYQAHADREAKEKYLTQLPDFLNASPPQLPAAKEPEREELTQLLTRLPLKEIKKILTQIRTAYPELSV